MGVDRRVGGVDGTIAAAREDRQIELKIVPVCF